MKKKQKVFIINIILLVVIALCSKVVIVDLKQVSKYKKGLDNVGKYIYVEGSIYRSNVENNSSLYCDGIDSSFMGI